MCSQQTLRRLYNVILNKLREKKNWHQKKFQALFEKSRKQHHFFNFFGTLWSKVYFLVLFKGSNVRFMCSQRMCHLLACQSNRGWRPNSLPLRSRSNSLGSFSGPVGRNIRPTLRFFEKVGVRITVMRKPRELLFFQLVVPLHSSKRYNNSL